MASTRSDNKTSSPLKISPSWDAFAEEYEKRVEPFTSMFAAEMLLRLLKQNGAKYYNQCEVGSLSHEVDLEPGIPVASDRNLKLLDVGCGTGAVALLALSHGLEVAVTDLSRSMVERTKERALTAIKEKGSQPGEELSHSQLEMLSASAVADGQDLPSRWSDSFDLAVANFSVIFFPEVAEGLSEIFRCLVPKTGVVSFTAWGSDSETPAFRVFPDVVSEILPELAETGKPKRITGSVPVLTKLLEEAGFVDVRVVGPVVKTLRVQDPSEYYDRFALTSPSNAAMIALMDASTRSAFRKRVMEVARERGGQTDGSVALDSGAYIACGRKPAPKELRD